MHFATAMLPCAFVLLTGCVAKTVLDVATLPVRAGADIYDRATVSDSERDQKRGRQIRQREERYGRLSRKYDRARAECRDGDEIACSDARRIYDEMTDLRATIPYGPE
ncbi:MAG: hypothetical protein B7Y36_05775 [Novosphingobium sp. 28-62-57]|uniref:hypothetical protein n=1 Tax=unclassified Novosphingobium TaxID=2644732 RepID=UPI000BDD7403|nr:MULTISPECIES: hypothetical protein [unclassified Novosphingobium]OYW50245.1 MAG: hypothetical protein B7Z34_05140 [Novosphingobium sp. 12-62-10]OYZ11650.1 MAG: hypothetical protein B7Y36_05775 [Novosphingobium sp. 28-62-57]OYZ97495.1 MAG: hypothetical protein B7X96_02820 [Novosphingobium sp. 17-62-8]HQS68825.1 hypothetical protein [Novosphingobium sp.]